MVNKLLIRLGLIHKSVLCEHEFQQDNQIRTVHCVKCGIKGWLKKGTADMYSTRHLPTTPKRRGRDE
jgi:DNA-directed RNA polymerase subunit RPC12/RpoP